MLIKAGEEPTMLLRSVERLLNRVLVPAVRVNPSDMDSSPGSVSARDHLLAGLRSFASCLHGNDFVLANIYCVSITHQEQHLKDGLS